jgi:AcrR family transcriptional regulator
MDRKQSIVEAAETCFTQYGFKAATMDQVSKMAHVGKGTIYTFYKNKEELFHAIIDQFILQMKQIADHAIHSEDKFDENLHRSLFEMLEFRKQHQLTLKLTQEVREIGTPEAQEALDRLEKTILTFLEGHLVHAIEAGDILPCEPQLTAFIMLKLYISLVFEWEKKHTPLSKEEISSIFEMYLMKGLKK